MHAGEAKNGSGQRAKEINSSAPPSKRPCRRRNRIRNARRQSEER
ncbi:MAG: hypothetical protein ACLR23_06335 [Clostridia bacterium]